jgi:AraC family transcriptional activator of pobA
MMAARDPIPVWQLYGERQTFPDLLHIERIRDRAAGLDWIIAPHRHLHLHQIFLLISGEITVSIDGREEALPTPAAINLPRTIVHGFRFSAGTEGYVLTLPAGDFPELLAEGAETAAALGRPFLLAPPIGVEARFASIARLHGEEAALRRTRLRAEVMALACDLLGALPVENEGVVGAPDGRVARFFEMVRAGLRDPAPVGDYAHRLGLSARHLSRLCHAATGLSAQRYMEEQRIREACRLLVYTRMPVQSVAFQLGFDDPAYFSRAFQRSAGLTPTAYRQRFE